MFKPLEIHNVIDHEYQDKLYHLVTDVKFPWHFLEDTTNEVAGPPMASSTPAFCHLLHHQNKETTSEYLDAFKPLVDAIIEKSGLELISVFRMRLGFLLNTKYVYMGSPYQYNTPHRDGNIDHYTAVYYLNTCDGPTVIFHETEEAVKYKPMHKSDPEKGKVLVFDGKHYHASTCPKVYNKRIALTINFTANVNQ
jgi:hypothetical protein